MNKFWKLNKEFRKALTVLGDDTPPPPPAAPGQFASHMWDLSNPATGGDLNIELLALPSANGSAITDIEYTTDAGATWLSIGGVIPDDYIISVESDGVTALVDNTLYTIDLRAVNAIGNGIASGDPKDAIPTSTLGWSFDSNIVTFDSMLYTFDGSPV